MPSNRRTAARKAAASETEVRVLKKYPNRRLYDTHASAYITLADVPPDVADDAVELLGWLELPLDDTPAAIITSFNEGFVPTSLNSDLFLPNELRRRLGLEKKSWIDTHTITQTHTHTHTHTIIYIITYTCMINYVHILTYILRT